MMKRVALIELLRGTVAIDLFPLSPRIRKLRAILAKLVPEPPQPKPLPAPRPSAEPSHALAKRATQRR
jgi:hypothetical protein